MSTAQGVNLEAPLSLTLVAAVALTLLAAAVHLPIAALAPDPYATGDVLRLGRLDALPIDDLAALKARHAEHTPAALGLFGNSRAIMVGSAELGLSPGYFFNYSLPGGSLRQSVALLEALQVTGSLPQAALVSLDHLSLNYYGPADWPGPPRRWRNAAMDIAYMARSGRGAADTLRATLDHLLTEWQKATAAMSVGRLQARFAYLLPATIPPLDATTRIQEVDGSRPEGGGRGIADRANAEMFFAMPAYLERDFARLGALAAGGLKLVVYESPVRPLSAGAGTPAEPHQVTANRVLVAELCQRFGLRCALAPPALGSADDWPDCCHPPAAVLGAHLRAVAPGLVDRP